MEITNQLDRFNVSSLSGPWEYFTAYHHETRQKRMNISDQASVGVALITIEQNVLADTSWRMNQ